MKCKICNNELKNIKYQVNENMYGTNEKFIYFECNECGCLQLDSTPMDMTAYYPSSYYSFNDLNRSGNNNNFKRWLIKTRDLFALEQRNLIGMLLNLIWPADKFLNILSTLQINNCSKILDIGSGNGIKLLSIADLGYKITGIDPFISKDITYNNGLRIYKKTIYEVSDTYDLIMLNHVFEHLSDPLKVLMKIQSLLNPGGKCLIRIPITSSFAWKHYGVNWVQIDAPRHLFLYSIDSLKLLANKSGFVLKNIIYDSTSFQFIGSELYKRGISFKNGDFSEKKNKYFTDKELEKFRKDSIELNEKKCGDQAAFILEKQV